MKRRRRHLQVLLTLTCILFVKSAMAGGNVPFLVKDINPTGFSSPMYLTKVGDRVFFNANDGVHGQELWISDGTEAGTYMVIDLIPGPDGSVPQQILEFNGKAMSQADNNQNGMDWYISDGTAAGTTRVGDIDVGGPGLPSQVCGFWDFPWGRAGPRIFYKGTDPAHGRELWVTDGTPAGTGLFKDLVPGIVGSSPAEFVEVGNLMFLEGDDHLWVSDLTPAGTIMIADVYPAGIISSNGKAFFGGNEGPDGAFGIEPWVSDGTPAGTHMLKDVYPGESWSNPGIYGEFNGLVYFNATHPQFGREWWVSDGTEEGTTMFMDLQPGPASSFAGDFFQVGDTTFFLARDPEHGRELWKTDGTPEGTLFLKDLRPGPDDSDARFFIESNGKLFFWAQIEKFEEKLWQSDGTETGTFPIPGLTGAAGPGATVGDLLFFMNEGELWALDTTPAPIPTLSAWSMIVFTLSIVLTGSVVVIHRAHEVNGSGS